MYGLHGPGLLGVALRERALWFFAAAKIRGKEKENDDADSKFQGPVT
jgi:hypothetical protein